MPSRSLGDDWRPKHEESWVGPMVVTQREAKTIYEVREVSTGRHYRRHVSNMAAYPRQVLEPQGLSDQVRQADSVSPAVLTGFVPGQVVAFSDEDDDKLFELGDVLRLEGKDEALVHMRGTGSAKIKSARFLPVHIESPTGLSILTAKMSKRLLSAGCTSKPWTGVITAADVFDFDVQLTNAHRLIAGSRKKLAALGLKHKIMS